MISFAFQARCIIFLIPDSVRGSFLKEGVSSVLHEESSLATSKGHQFALGAALWKFIGTIND